MTMASQQPDEDMLIDVDQLVSAYYDEHPDPSDPGQAVSFGTSGHRGRSLDGTFTEDHIVAISQAIARYRVAEGIDGTLFLGLKEVPVGFKRFVGGLLGGSLAFGGEKSAGASFLRHDGGAWSTDKDGLIMCLLAAEMTARGGKDSGELYAELTGRYGAPVYRRVGTPATPEQKRALGALAPDDVRATELAGEPIAPRRRPAPLGGVKVVTPSGWFPARPSGTEDVYKLYAESFEGEQHLDRILEQAGELLDRVLVRNES
jgi:phosphoglucomutase